MDFSSAAELLKICQASGIPISQAMIDRETLYLGADTVTTYSRMEHSYEIMKNAVHSAVTEDIRSLADSSAAKPRRWTPIVPALKSRSAVR